MLSVIPLTQDYNRNTSPFQHNIVVYWHLMSCLQAIEGKGTDNPLICQIMNLWWLRYESTRVCICWDTKRVWQWGNERIDQLAKVTHDHDTDPLASVHSEDWKPLYPGGGMNKVGCVGTWQRPVSLEINTTKEIPVSNQSWVSRNYLTSSWAHQGQ